MHALDFGACRFGGCILATSPPSMLPENERTGTDTARTALPRALGISTEFACALAGALVCAACGGGEEDRPPRDEGKPALISFELVAYLDANASHARVLERILREDASVTFALRRRGEVVARRKQVDVDVKRILREPVTLVDPDGGARKPMLRVRYWSVGLTQVPEARIAAGEAPFGALFTDDESKAAALEPCLVNDASGKPMWQRFAPEAEACRRLIEDEQRAVDALRARANASPREIVPLEQGRLCLPVTLHYSPQAKKVKPADSAPPSDASAPEHVEDASVPTPAGIEPPGSGNDEPRVATVADKERERALAETDEDETEETRKIRRPSFVVAGDKPKGEDYGPLGPAHAPNFAFLWIVGLVVVAIAGNEYRRRKRRAAAASPFHGKNARRMRNLKKRR
jgi:hypothetical protein